MRKTFAVVLVLAVAVAAIPGTLFAAVAGARQQSGTLNGVAQAANKTTLPNYTVNVRNASTGQVAGSTTSSATGTFSFAGLAPGTYVVEIVDAAGKIVGLSASVSVAAGAAVTVTVTASAAGAIAAAAGGGFGLLGLGTAATVAVVGAAGATAIVAVRATSKTASPSK
jgi:carboxypeptidase family protein